jgi:hypothetical protein
LYYPCPPPVTPFERANSVISFSPYIAYGLYFFHTESGEKKLIAVFQVAQNVYYIADAE